MARRHLTTRAEIAQLTTQYDNFVFDCDGVLWQDGHLLPGTGAFTRCRAGGSKAGWHVINAGSLDGSRDADDVAPGGQGDGLCHEQLDKDAGAVHGEAPGAGSSRHPSASWGFSI